MPVWRWPAPTSGGLRIIAPSRFGYLGSTLAARASSAGQADAYVSVLDRLGVDRAAVFGFSGGGPSAMQFALRHPDRATALVLLSSALPGPVTLPPRLLADLLFGSDAFFWGLAAVQPRLLARILGVPRGLRLGPRQWMGRDRQEEPTCIGYCWGCS
jgi:2-hydroxy-6-oxonona-2,4-dienedioate hydrolase